MLSAKDLVKEISDKSGRAEAEVRRLIKDKQLELSGLVSEEGAAYIVGRELGVDLMKDSRRGLKIKNVLPDMMSVDITAKVMNIFGPKEFDKNGKKGVVASLILGDDSGTTRLPLWNDEVKLLSSLGIAQGDIIEVSGAWAKNDERSGVELRLGKRGRLKKAEGHEGFDVEMAEPDYQRGSSGPAERALIADLKAGMNAVIKGCIVQAYKKRPYYEICPKCGSRAEEKDDKFLCKEHGEVEPDHALIFSGVIDDGTGNIRAVFFRDQAEKIYGKTPKDVFNDFSRNGLDTFWEKFGALGKELLVEGRVKVSDFTKEAELLASDVREVDARDEARRLMEGLEAAG